MIVLLGSVGVLLTVVSDGLEALSLDLIFVYSLDGVVNGVPLSSLRGVDSPTSQYLPLAHLISFCQYAF